MDEDDLVEVFEEERPRLLRVAARILGGSADAEDVVQSTWLKTEQARRDRPDVRVDSLPGWLTVVIRTALDLLRFRGRQGETSFNVTREEVASREVDGQAADESALLIDEVCRALSLVVDRLERAARVAFVLHDLFAVPFDDIGTVLGRSPADAKQPASRARHRVGLDPTTPPVPTDRPPRCRPVVPCCFSRDGDLMALLRCLELVQDHAGGLTPPASSALKV